MLYTHCLNPLDDDERKRLFLAFIPSKHPTRQIDGEKKGISGVIEKLGNWCKWCHEYNNGAFLLINDSYLFPYDTICVAIFMQLWVGDTEMCVPIFVSFQMITFDLL